MMSLPRCSTVVLHRQNPAVRETPDFEGLFRCRKSVAEREGLSPLSAFKLARFAGVLLRPRHGRMIARNNLSYSTDNSFSTAPKSVRQISPNACTLNTKIQIRTRH
jgi:hypothetical protein